MAFSEIEKINIRENLLRNCEDNWSKFGYKKTNIDELCSKAGISKGAFYLFYNSKEELFCDVMLNVQKRLMDLTEETLGNSSSKYDLGATLKLLYREYDKTRFITETHSPDFIAFMNKLPKEKINEIEEHGNYDLKNIIKKAGIQYKIEEDKAISALGIIFTPVVEIENYPWNYLEVIDFMLDTIIEAAFE